MRKYETPELKATIFSTEDILTSSWTGEGVLAPTDPESGSTVIGGDDLFRP